MTNEEASKQAFELYKSIQDIEYSRRLNYLKIANYFLTLQETTWYKFILGDDNATWATFLAQPEILYSRNQIYEMGRVYKHFVVNLGIAIQDLGKVDFQRLIKMIPHTDKNNIEEWLKKGELLSPQDFKNEIREIKGILTTEDCKHQDKHQYDICVSCGFKQKHV